MRYIVYNLLLLISFPFILIVLFTKKRCRRGLGQRLGFVPSHLQGIQSPVFWIHAVSLGEVTAVIPLVHELHSRYPNNEILISTVTDTGREAVEQRLPGKARHFYCPLDFPWAVSAFVRALRPEAFFVVETELWPNLLRAFDRQRVPTVLVNGRLSSRSFKRYGLIKGFMTQVLSTLSLCLMQSERDAQRIKALGANPHTVHQTGNMKFDQGNGDGQEAVSLPSKNMIGLVEGEKLLVAGSTHVEEEGQLVRCYQQLCAVSSNFVLLLAPRHIERIESMMEMVVGYGLPCVRKSQISYGTEPHISVACPRVILLDTRGELATLYALGWITFVGGTLVPVGGHNLLEPARWGKPVFFGPFTDHCDEIAEWLLENGGGVQVKNEDDLLQQILRASQEESWIEDLGKSARAVFVGNRGAVKKNVDLVSLILNPLSSRQLVSALDNG